MGGGEREKVKDDPEVSGPKQPEGQSCRFVGQEVGGQGIGFGAHYTELPLIILCRQDSDCEFGARGRGPGERQV